MAFLHWHNGFEVHPCGSLHHLLFVLPNNISCYGHVPHFYLSIHPWLGIWVVFCYLVTSDAAVNTPVRAAVCVCVLISLEYSPGSGAAGSHVNWVFNIWKTRQTVFQSVCPRMHPHQQGTRAPAPPCCPHLLLSVCWMLVIGVGVWWDLAVASICISPVSIFSCVLSAFIHHGLQS